MKVSLIVAISLFIQLNCFAQAAISVSASRIYFSEGGSKEQAFIVRNPDKDTLKIKLSIQDWDYDSLGNNKIYKAGELATSLANYLVISSDQYLSLAPGEVDTIRMIVQDNIPKDSIPVRTAMLYLTQQDDEGEATTAIKALVQMGVKVYYKNDEYPISQIQISNFIVIQSDQETKKLKLFIHNTGNIWLDGNIQYQLLNLDTREMIKLEKTPFFSLPDDIRQVKIDLPMNLKRGNYIAYALVEPLTNNSINNFELTFTN